MRATHKSFMIPIKIPAITFGKRIIVLSSFFPPFVFAHYESPRRYGENHRNYEKIVYFSPYVKKEDPPGESDKKSKACPSRFYPENSPGPRDWHNADINSLWHFCCLTAKGQNPHYRKRNCNFVSVRKAQKSHFISRLHENPIDLTRPGAGINLRPT